MNRAQRHRVAVVDNTLYSRSASLHQGQVVQKSVKANPGLKVNRSINFWNRNVFDYICFG